MSRRHVVKREIKKEEAEEAAPGVFKEGDFVWARTNHTHSWPAKVIAPSTEEQIAAQKKAKADTVLCHLFGNNDFSFLEPRKLRAFDCEEGKQLLLSSKRSLFASSLKEALAAHPAMIPRRTPRLRAPRRAAVKMEEGEDEAAAAAGKSDKRAKKVLGRVDTQAATGKTTGKTRGKSKATTSAAAPRSRAKAVDSKSKGKAAKETTAAKGKAKRKRRGSDSESEASEYSEYSEEEESGFSVESDSSDGGGSDGSSDESDRSATPEPEMSEYEARRLENIRKNAEMLAALNIPTSEAKPSSATSTPLRRQPARGVQATKQAAAAAVAPVKRSARLQGLTAEGEPLPAAPEKHDSESSLASLCRLLEDFDLVEGHPVFKPKGEDAEEEEEERRKQRAHFLALLRAAAAATTTAAPGSGKDAAAGSDEDESVSQRAVEARKKAFYSRVRQLKMDERCMAKVVPERIFSIAIHPSPNHTIVLAGDKAGYIGVFDCDSTSDLPATAASSFINSQGFEEGEGEGEGEDPAGEGKATIDYKPSSCVALYRSHLRAVSCIAFMPERPSMVLSSSYAYDGVVRAFDVESGRSEVLLAFPDELDQLTSFSYDRRTCALYTAHGNGSVSRVDMRARKQGDIGDNYAVHARKVSHVHVNPVHTDYIVTSSLDKMMSVWDVRMLNRRSPKPVYSKAHGLSVCSAYFSCVSGNRLVSTSYDDKIRIFTNAHLTGAPDQPKAISHNNQTGRWLTSFKAIFPAKNEDCIVVGSMGHPRGIEVFDADTTKLVHRLEDPTYLTSVTSVHAWHPERDVLVGGNSSGKVFVLRDV